MWAQICVSRKDGKWAKTPAMWAESKETAWETLAREMPEVWNALPPSAEATKYPISSAREFSDADSLVEWIEEANCEGFRVLARFGSVEIDETFPVEADATAYAQTLWEDYGDVDGGVAAVQKLPLESTGFVETVWCRGGGLL